jgi:hypothetical protein
MFVEDSRATKVVFVRKSGVNKVCFFYSVEVFL